MSNQVEKFGLRPYRKLDGTPLVGAQNRYTIASGLAGAIFQGEMVQPLASGIDISQDPENSDTSSANANILVRINNHFYRSGTGL